MNKARKIAIAGATGNGWSRVFKASWKKIFSRF